MSHMSNNNKKKIRNQFQENFCYSHRASSAHSFRKNNRRNKRNQVTHTKTLNKLISRNSDCVFFFFLFIFTNSAVYTVSRKQNTLAQKSTFSIYTRTRTRTHCSCSFVVHRYSSEYEEEIKKYQSNEWDIIENRKSMLSACISISSNRLLCVCALLLWMHDLLVIFHFEINIVTFGTI